MGLEIQGTGFEAALNDAREQFATERQLLLIEKDELDARRACLEVELEETKSQLSSVLDEIHQLRSHVARLRAAIGDASREFAAERRALLQENIALDTKLEEAQGWGAQANARAEMEIATLRENQARAAAEWDGERLSLTLSLDAVGEEIRNLLRQQHVAEVHGHSRDKILERPSTPQIANLRAASPEAIVRILFTPRELATDADGSCQALVILPHAVRTVGAIIDLDMCSDMGGRIALDLHVIVGEVAIAMISRSGNNIIIEHSVSAGPPFTRVELEFRAEDVVGSLVFRNLSKCGPTKMMLHSLECKMGPCDSHNSRPGAREVRTQFLQFASLEGRQVLAEKLELFRKIISKLEDIYDVHPFNQQTAQSLLELSLLVTTIRPGSVFELGTGSRSSTIALALAAADVPGCTVFGVDISPSDFQSLVTNHFSDLRFGAVVDIAAEATSFEIPDDWRRPILMLYDAHDGDLPGKHISHHAISRWFPKLAGQTVAIHDCTVFPCDDGIDYPGHVKASHWSGRAVVGFPEIGPLVGWMNREHIDFWRPGDELEGLGFAGWDSSLIALTIPTTSPA